MDAATDLRLFVGLIPPAAVAEHLARAVARLPADLRSPEDLRWTAVDRWHLTLAFLGAVPADRVTRLERELDQAARAAVTTPSVHLRGCGRFGNRAAWIGVQEEASSVGALTRLARGIRRACREGRCPPAEGPWRAHLTLARLRRRGDPASIRRLTTSLADYRGPNWTVGSISLIESFLGASPRYESRATWTLGG